MCISLVQGEALERMFGVATAEVRMLPLSVHPACAGCALTGIMCTLGTGGVGGEDTHGWPQGGMQGGQAPSQPAPSPRRLLQRIRKPYRNKLEVDL